MRDQLRSVTKSPLPKESYFPDLDKDRILNLKTYSNSIFLKCIFGCSDTDHIYYKVIYA